LMGVRRTRKIGLDNEFERLRDYTRDDNYKHIDWRTTARRNKLTVKDFQTNQSQRIIFMVDCGRMMTNEAAGLSLLDHAFNAVLLMSYVALRQGDSVGLVCFSNEIHTFVPPRSGMKQMNQLLHASFDRFPQLVESRYDEAFLYLRTHCPKRALVVLITNVIDEVNSHQIEQYLGSIVGRHLPLAVLIRDHRLFDAADHPVGPEDSLYRAAAAAEILTWRHQVLTDLEHNGVLTIDTFPEDMTARQLFAQMSRMQLQGSVPSVVHLSDAELNDSFYYTVFPNMHPWGAYNKITYRFRPYGNDPGSCIMEVIYLAPFLGKRPAPAEIHWLDFDQSWTEAPELGPLCQVFDQDTFNLPRVQRGLENAQHTHVTFASYQETKLRHFHSLLDKYIAA